MSFLSGVKSFFEAIGSELKKFFGSATVEQEVQGALTVIGAAISTITSMVNPALGAVVSGILKQIQTDYATASSVVQAAIPVSGSTATTVVTTVAQSLQTNLAALLADAGVKSSANYAKIQAEATTILNEVEAIAAAFAPAASSSTSAPAVS